MEFSEPSIMRAPELEAYPRLAELVAAIENWPHAQSLRRQVRWNDFRPDHIDSESWAELLGPDVNGLEHGYHMAGLAEKIINGNRVRGHRLNAHALEALKLTCLFHDLAEYDDRHNDGRGGDRSRPSKTLEHELSELNQLETEILPYFVNRGHINQSEAYVVIETLRSNHDPSAPRTDLGALFGDLEAFGYFHTGLTAQARVQNAKLDRLTSDNLQHLAGAAIVSNIETVYRFGQRFIEAKQLIDACRPLVETALRWTLSAGGQSRILARHRQVLRQKDSNASFDVVEREVENQRQRITAAAQRYLA